MQAQHDADVVLRFVDDFFVVRVAEEREHRALNAQRRFDNVRDIVLVGFLIEVGEVLAGGILVLGQVVVGTIRHTPEFAPAEREEELEVGRRLGVEAELFRIVVAEAQVFFFDAQREQPIAAEAAPVGEPFEVGVGLAEEFEFHLLEFTHAEDEVARRDFVAEGFTDLADAERQLFAGGALDIGEVDEDALRGFRTQIDGVFRVFGNALEGLEHQVELTDIGEVVLAAGRAGNVVVFDESLHFFLRKGVDRLFEGDALFGAEIFNELVGAEAFFAFAAVHQRVGEAAEVARSDPSLRIHQDRGVEADVVRIFLNEFFPPGAFDIVFQFGAERTVVPSVGEATVDFAAAEDKASVFAESNDLVHGFVCVEHKF